VSTSTSAPARERRRVRVAHATLARVEEQRERFASDYGGATTAQQRFNAVAFALRSAAATGRHQPDPEQLAGRLDALTDQMKALLDELFEAQQATADKTIRTDQRRIARNERRRGCDGRTTHNTHPTPERPGFGTAAS
jgi:hypothetical protein